MRVLQIGKYYPPHRGGMEAHLEVLCGELKNRVDLDVLVCNNERRQRTETIDGVRVTRCFEIARVASASICPTMPLEIARRRYDVIHFHFPHPVGAMSYLVGPRRHPHAVIVSYHADIVRQRRLLEAYRPFMRMLLRRADAIVCATPSYRESSVELEDYKHKVEVIPFGIDFAKGAPTAAVMRVAAEIRARHGGRPIVLGVGRLVPYKGFEHLVRAMRQVDATLLLVGAGPLRESLESLAREVSVRERVQFLGEMDDIALRACYEACDVFVLPSIDRSEAFALVQLEAMAAGKPVVNTSIPGSGVAWVSRDDESGLTVPPRDPEALAAAMNRLLADASLRARLGSEGRARVEREFTKRVMADRVIKLYRSLAPTANDGTDGHRARSRREPFAADRNP